MKLGIYLRNMGPQSARDVLVECAKLADASDLDDLWVADHIAIPPDQSEGSGGRYLDPLATLAFLAAATSRIGLGTGVLVVPYRPLLATAKWVATIQELSGNRLLLGVGAGWMEAEFRAVGVDPKRRDAITDETLASLRHFFAADRAEVNGQPFLFLPRPPCPPIYVGGFSDRALRRAVELGDGWMPNAGDPSALEAGIARLAQQARAAEKPVPEVVALTSLPLAEPDRAIERARALARAGVAHVVHAERYPDAAAFGRAVEVLSGSVRPAVS